MKTVLFFVSQILACAWAYAGTLEVCPDCDVKSIREAISIARPFDTIYVRSATYLEDNIRIEKPLTLIGLDRPVIDGRENGEILGVYSDSVTIIGFNIKNVGISHTKDQAAIHLYNVKAFHLENNVLENVFFGMLIEKSHQGLIRNNTISGESKREFFSGNGVHLWHCSEVLIEGNHLSGLRDGIYLEFVTESEVASNHCEGNLRYGLHFMFSDHDVYRNNHFENNGAGVAVMFSKFVSMLNNKFVKNWGTSSYGLLLKEIYDAEIKYNVFEENTIGINIDGSTRIKYEYNTLSRNGWAVKVTGGCYTNSFENNNFIANAFNVSYNSKLNDNSFDGNYWSDYTGYDLNKDKVGDVPFRPVNLFSYMVNRTPETIILLRSLFVDLMNFSEKVSPVFTPDNLMDNRPSMKEIKW